MYVYNWLITDWKLIYDCLYIFCQASSVQLSLNELSLRIEQLQQGAEAAQRTVQQKLSEVQQQLLDEAGGKPETPHRLGEILVVLGWVSSGWTRSSELCQNCSGLPRPFEQWGFSCISWRQAILL